MDNNHGLPTSQESKQIGLLSSAWISLSDGLVDAPVDLQDGNFLEVFLFDGLVNELAVKMVGW